MTRWWQLARAYGLDALIALAALATAAEVALSGGAPDGPQTAQWFAVPALTLVVLMLLGRRRFPFAAPAAVWLWAAALSFVDGRLVPLTATASIAGFTGAYLLGNLRDAAQARLGLAIVAGGAAIVIYNDPSSAGGDLVFTPLLFLLGWLTGFAMRGRAEQAEAAEARASRAERERQVAARIAVAEERGRIARELHNLARTSPDDAEALQRVESTGRTALAEMRRLLGAMRRDGDELALEPQPGLGNLGALSEQVSRAGLPVRVHIDGEPYPLPHALDVSAYRIVQEGLTNALKHAHASHAEVTVRYGAEELYLEVRDDGAGVSAGDGHGHGLVGIRERVKIYGGEMSADRDSRGGFVLSTRLPIAGRGP